MGVIVGFGGSVGTAVAAGGGVRVGVGVGVGASTMQPLSAPETNTTAANPAPIHVKMRALFLCSVWFILLYLHLRFGDSPFAGIIAQARRPAN
jgi:hypothetical protein